MTCQTGIKRCRGLSLIDLMIGTVIGMILLVFVMQLFLTSESRRRTTTSVNEAQVNGLFALSIVERYTRMAGVMNCPIVRAYNKNASPTIFELRWAPILITDGGNASDQLTVLYSNSATAGTPVADLDGTHNSSAAVTDVTNVAGITTGDFLVFVQPARPCTVIHVTGLSGSKIHHNPSSPYNAPSGSQFPVNGDPGCPPGPGGRCDYTAAASLINFGQLVHRRYQINVNNQLEEVDVSKGDAVAVAPSVIADHIVNMQAQYGISASASSDVVNQWVDATGPTWGTSNTTPTASNLLRIKAVRIAAVARSTLRERDEVSPAAIKIWPDSVSVPTTTGPRMTLDAEARHYRYKVYATIVPLRNVLWNN